MLYRPLQAIMQMFTQSASISNSTTLAIQNFLSLYAHPTYVYFLAIQSKHLHLCMTINKSTALFQLFETFEGLFTLGYFITCYRTLKRGDRFEKFHLHCIL